MFDAVNNSGKQRGRPFQPGVSGNARGRPKGSRNKRTRAVLEAAIAGGEMPLDYMLAVMRDPGADDKRRDAMAMAAAPYLHPKLSSLDAKLSSASDKFGDVDRIELTFVRPQPRGIDEDADGKLGSMGCQHATGPKARSVI
jgi:hypothetical protein